MDPQPGHPPSVGERLVIHIVVLLKLVPDIRHIPDDAWDLDRGTLKRNRLKLIPNLLDDRALALALAIRRTWGGQVTALSMGPPRADEICARALAFGADEAVLVTDKACAGSDTLATSFVLSRAIDRLSGSREELLVIAGMQSPDGDTAQVPVQVAAGLGASVVPYLTDVAVADEQLDYSAIASSGSVAGRLERGRLPAVLTCTEQLEAVPFHTSLERLRDAARVPVGKLTASDLGLTDEQVGLAGSATRVVRISVSESVRRDVEFIDWPGHTNPELTAGHVVERLERGLSGPERAPASSAEEPSPAVGRPGTHGPGDSPVLRAVWAYLGAQPEADRLAILAHARAIATSMECATVACAIGSSRDDLRGPVGRAGATELLLIQTDDRLDPVGEALALEAAVRNFRPGVVLLPASPEGRVSAPYLAARMGAGLTADCTGFEVKDFSMRRKGERTIYHDMLYQKRPALGGNIEATIVSPRNVERDLPQLATVRPGPTVPQEGAGPVPVHIWQAPTMTGDDAASRSLARPVPAAAAESSRVEIERCKVLVSVGRGVGGSDGIAQFAEPLARALKIRFEIDVEVSASRMVVDAGDLGRERQVGQTGKTVKPDIYIALGISGSAQHRAGMEESAMILSVNSDAEAPIRTISDVFVHGRVEEVVPGLIRAIEQAK